MLKCTIQIQTDPQPLIQNAPELATGMSLLMLTALVLAWWMGSDRTPKPPKSPVLVAA